MPKSGISKLIIAGVILLLIIKFQILFKDLLLKISDESKKMLTQIEVDKITHRMYVDYNSNGQPLPSYTESEWRDYIRKKSNPSAKERDPGKDLWGTSLQIRNSENTATHLSPGVVVRSAGADRKMNTKDDIFSICKKEKE